MLMFAAVPAIQGLPQTSDVNEINMVDLPVETTKSAGNILFDFDMQTLTGQQHVGAEWDGTYYWSTACGSSAGGGVAPYKIYKFTSAGVLAGTYLQPAAITTGWGMRDMAFDGTYLYAGAETGLWQIDPATGATTLMFSSIAPMAVIRALCWVPLEGMFYSGNFGNSFYKFPPSGTPITAVTNPGLTAVYGMAYDSINDSIWCFDQTGTPLTKFVEYNYHTQTLTGKIWQVPLLTGATAQTAGGCFYATNCISGKAVLGGCTQGTPVDRMFVMELGNAGTPNQPPVTPAAPTGPTSGNVGVSYSFTANTTDPDGDNISYMFDWGDGNDSGWLGPYASGTPKTQAYTWNAVGVYDVKVKAKDINDDESGWSAVHAINITSLPTPNIEIQTITGGLLKVKATIKNTGAAAATNVSWKIQLTGGLIILGKESTGKNLTINASATATVTSKLILGFGKTVIKVTADTATKSVNATVLLVFIKV